MPTNKNAQLRYQIIDKCLSNWSRRYYIEDLVDACNEALYLYNGETKDGCGVKKRQVQEDLKFIESEEGYSMEIDAIRDGHRKYYRYHTKGIRGNTKSKTNYTYDIDIQQIKEDRKKYEKSQCFPFASHFGLKRG